MEEVYCICRSTAVDRFMIGCDNCNEWFHGDCIGVTERDARDIKKFFCGKCREKDSSLSIVYKKRHLKRETCNKRPLSPKAGRYYEDPDYEEQSGEEPPLKKRRRKLDQLARKRRAKSLKLSVDSDEESGEGTSRSFGCGQCIGCFRNQDCGKCDSCKDMKKFGGPGSKKERCSMRRCVNEGSAAPLPSFDHSLPKELSKDSMPRKEGGVKLKHVQRKQAKKKPLRRATRDDESFAPMHGTRARARKFDEFLKDAGLTDLEDEEIMQCLGPQCTNAARPKSKYCSDACGLKLGTMRLKQLLPPRVEEFYANGGSDAHKRDQTQLESIRRKQMVAKRRLEELYEQEQQLDKWCEKITSGTHDIASPTDGADSSCESDSGESEQNIFCVTCGHEISLKNALRHMTKCFNKLESQSSYGSSFKTVNDPYKLFCDEHNRVNNTYCKRLRIMCPEHFKEKKVGEDDICGCPLSDQLFDNQHEFSSMCRIPKKKCIRHYKWERIRRGIIDMERLSQLLRLDELWEEERSVKTAMSNRCNVLGLLLHSTTNHAHEATASSMD